MKCIICQNECTHSKELPNLFTNKYCCSHCSTYYIEPTFQARLDSFEQRYHGKNMDLITAEMKRIVLNNPVVVFIGDYENPITTIEEAIFVEFEDITNRLKIYVNDISRGSDYGD